MVSQEPQNEVLYIMQSYNGSGHVSFFLLLAGGCESSMMWDFSGSDV